MAVKIYNRIKKIMAKVMNSIYEIKIIVVFQENHLKNEVQVIELLNNTKKYKMFAFENDKGITQQKVTELEK